MDCYLDMDDVESAFVSFMDKVPFYGAITACIDNPQLAKILPRVQRRLFTYGVAANADYRLEVLDGASELGDRANCAISGFRRFTVHTANGPLGPFELRVPGRHNILNATAAVAIACQLEVPADLIAQGLASFNGVDRRFQLRGRANGINVVDDYGHHPTEIAATLAAARECGYGKIHVIFQPHRYTRTRDLLPEFATAFTLADSVTVLPIYAASEEPIEGITAELLAARIRDTEAHFAPDFASAVASVTQQAQPGDLILTLGAGSVSQLGPQVLAALEAATVAV
jgi:UDP-N-acetylmuramate--alanine ligase